MPSASQPFHELQELDSSLEQLGRKLEAVRLRLATNPEIEALRGELERTSLEIDDGQRQIRRLEAAIDDENAGIERWSRTLYGGKVGDSRELLSLQKEIQSAQERRSRLEDELLDLMQRLEELAALQADQRLRLNKLEQRWDAERVRLQAEKDGLVQLLDDLKQRRRDVAEALGVSGLNVYERLRASSGHAVSTVRDGICEWCRVQVPARDVQHARGPSIVTCTTCTRILYVP